jgi:hypothetical protein
MIRSVYTHVRNVKETTPNVTYVSHSEEPWLKSLRNEAYFDIFHGFLSFVKQM